MEKNTNYESAAFSSTDLNYLSKRKMDASYGPIVGQTFWGEVDKYRREHRVQSPFKSIEGYPFYFTLTDTLKGKWQNALDRLGKTVQDIATSLNEKERKEFRKDCFLTSLKAIAALESIDIPELSIKAAINGTYAESEESHKLALNYLAALDSYSEKSASPADEDFLAECYAKVLNESELVSFYREAKGKSNHISASFGKPAKGAPDGEVEIFLEPFFDFLKSGKAPSLVSLSAIFFYLPYIAPFERDNVSTAILFAKNFLANLYGKEAYLLPLESLLLPSKELSDALRETKATFDLTYFVEYLAIKLDEFARDVEERIKKARIAVYSPEYNQLSKEEKEAVSEKALLQPLPPKNEQLTLDAFGGFQDEKAMEEAKPAQEENEPEPAVQEPNEENEGTHKPSQKNALRPTRTISLEEITEAKRKRPSFGYEADILSEKEAKEYMRYLLETNPNLNKKQALFLSTHCTEGRFYSIQQFKAFTHCVYETARTSMDKLAQEGYYEKLQVKNKFVYTPKKKGDSKQ